MKNLWNNCLNLWNNFLNLLLPFYCALCKKHSDQKFICSSCFKSLVLAQSVPCCKYCGIKLENEDVCQSCFGIDHYFNKVASVFVYDENITILTNKFKFSDGSYLAKYFAEYILCYCCDLLEDVELIIPVPMHRIRLYSRKYNQALLIAKFIGKNLKIKVDHSILKKTRHTYSQLSSTVTKRKSNLNNSFAVINNEKINNKIICLIDDVITTGSTIRECSKELSYNTYPPKEIRVISFARSIKY